MIARNVSLLLAGFLLITISTIAACSKAGEHSLDNVPAEWKSIVSPGNTWSFVVPVTLDDGTRCVVLTSNGNRGGITCDWGKK
jgi:hypothetical protein